MSTVAFWGSVHGQAATTSNAMAVALMMALDNDIKTMITQTHLTHSTLESSLHKDNEEDSLLHFSDMGIDALERLARSNRLSPKSVPNYTLELIRDRLDLLMGTTKKDSNLFENLNEVIFAILEAARQHYDFTFIDTHSGSRNEMSQSVLTASDLIVVNLPQNKHVLDQFFIENEYPNILQEKEHIFIVSQFDTQSKMTIKNIKRLYGITKEVLPLHYHTEYRDAINEQRVVDFFYTIINASRRSHHHPFLSSIRKINEIIESKVNSDLKKEKIEGQGA